MPKVTHIEFQAESPENLSQFYTDVFGWVVFKKQGGVEDYWLAHTGTSDEAGINAGIKRKSRGGAPVIPTISVASVQLVADKITASGGKVLGEKKVIPGTGVLVYCQDVEGNLFAILEKGV